MSKFRGLCVGGVADGHVIERDDVRCIIQARERAPSEAHIEAPMTEPEAHTVLRSTNYRFMWLLRNTVCDIGVWVKDDPDVPEPVMTMAVIQRLIDCYNPRAGLIGQPAANSLKFKGQ